jgi:hypothetical protein
MVEVELSRILISEAGGHQVIWLREKHGKRSFPILIGIFEALAIHRRIKNEEYPRPMTHDLLAGVIESLDCRLTRVVVTALHETTFFAKLVLGRNGAEVEVDCRPSDAIALAVRVEAPIFVEEEVLEEVAKEENASDETAL